MSKAKIKERRVLKERQKIKKEEPTKIPFKERHARFFQMFWRYWFVGLIVILLVVLVQLYLQGQLSILIPKERVLFR